MCDLQVSLLEFVGFGTIEVYSKIFFGPLLLKNGIKSILNAIELFR